MLQMGGDFGFENANAWFKNLDVLMEAVNREGRVNVRDLDIFFRSNTFTTLLYAVHSTEYTLHSTHYTVHITQYIVHITQHTVYITIKMLSSLLQRELPGVCRKLSLY